MENRIFEKRQKEEKPVLAICYDFDKTLSPDDMQAQGYIQKVGYENANDFWAKSNALAEDNEMDQNLAYMYQMMIEAEGTLLFTKETLRKEGSKVILFPGVEDWFRRIREYGADKGIIVEHYIISSGLKEMIEGTSIAKEFEKIYASSFYYNDRGVAKWPAQAVNYTNKTQFLFRIEKGILDVNDTAVNSYYEPDKIRVPFRNMVYIGDSDTDIPCMKLVNSHGGHSIGVYNAETQEKTKVYKMMREGRIRYFAPADYSEGSELDKLVKTIIDRTATNELLESYHLESRAEQTKADRDCDEEEITKTELMIDLDNSGSFAITHEVIKKLSAIKKWTSEQTERLCEIAKNNSQIYLILQDEDVRKFFKQLLMTFNSTSESVLFVKEKIN
jgi:hypothetical protein